MTSPPAASTSVRLTIPDTGDVTQDLQAFAHEERYQTQHSQDSLAPLDAQYSDYSEALGKASAPVWTDWISKRYESADYADVAQVLAQQGFHLV